VLVFGIAHVRVAFLLGILSACIGLGLCHNLSTLLNGQDTHISSPELCISMEKGFYATYTQSSK